MLILETLNYFT